MKIDHPTMPPGQECTRVLIVDDSAAMRAMLKKMLQADPNIDVVGTAADAEIARRMVRELRPDVMVLDVQMPGMDGIRFLERIMRLRPMPVVMCSALTDAGTDMAIEAMRLGAVECIGKPSGGPTMLMRHAQTLRRSVKTAARSTIFQGPRERADAGLPPSNRYNTDMLIAIGASTGGVEALFALLSSLPPDMPPILIVQHMPAMFTRGFAARLDRFCPTRVVEARDGDAIQPGTAYIAPGSDSHMELSGPHDRHIRLTTAPPVQGHRPSVDKLFASCAPMGERAIGVILTGMGKDGAQGLLAMREAGAQTFGQNEKSCVIYGMPRAARLAGGVMRELALDAIPRAILRACREQTGVC